MKVLFLSQRVPYPPNRGDRITTYHFLQHFLAMGASIRIGCLAEEEADAASIAWLRERVDEVCAPRIRRGVRKITSLRGLLTGDALTRTFFHHSELQATVDRWIAEDPPDLVYLYSSSMGCYVMHHPQLLRFMQFAELDSDKWRQYAAVRRGLGAWIYGREAVKLLAFEAEIARSFDLSAVCSPVEKELFMERIPGVTPMILPNGVDVDHFQTQGDAERNPHRALFTGVMDYEPNVKGVLWFVETCWPGIRAAVPDATFSIVGSSPSEAIRGLDGRDGIRVAGRVPEVPPFMDQAAVAVAPLKLARGIQNKVLEAMSASLPVVATSQAAQGLPPVGDDTLLVANDPETTVAAVTRLMLDPAAARRMGGNAARFVREHFRWEHQYGPFDAWLAERTGKTVSTGSAATVG